MDFDSNIQDVIRKSISGSRYSVIIHLTTVRSLAPSSQRTASATHIYISSYVLSDLRLSCFSFMHPAFAIIWTLWLCGCRVSRILMFSSSLLSPFGQLRVGGRWELMRGEGTGLNISCEAGIFICFFPRYSDQMLSLIHISEPTRR